MFFVLRSVAYAAVFACLGGCDAFATPAGGDSATEAGFGTGFDEGFGGGSAFDMPPPERLPDFVITSRDPHPDEIGVPSDATVVVGFSEPIRSSGYLVPPITLNDAQGVVESTYTVDTGRRLVLTPAAPMTRGARYYVVLDSVAAARDPSVAATISTDWHFYVEDDEDGGVGEGGVGEDGVDEDGGIDPGR